MCVRLILGPEASQNTEIFTGCRTVRPVRLGVAFGDKAWVNQPNLNGQRMNRFYENIAPRAFVTRRGHVVSSGLHARRVRD